MLSEEDARAIENAVLGKGRLLKIDAVDGSIARAMCNAAYMLGFERGKTDAYLSKQDWIRVEDAWLVEAERLLVECVNHQYELGKASARNEPMGMGADVPFIAMQAHLRSHPAEAQLEAARKDVEKLRALYRAMREPMAMIGMDKHIGPFSDEAIALLDAMNALDGGTYSKSEGS